MTTDRSFSVRGKRVIVVGAARSGVAAAELLVRRGATVTLSDVRDRLDEDERLRGDRRRARARRPSRQRRSRPPTSSS